MYKKIAALLLSSFAVFACTAADVQEPTSDGQDNQEETASSEDEAAAETSQSALRVCNPGQTRTIRANSCCGGNKQRLQKQRCIAADNGVWVNDGTTCATYACAI